MFLFRRLKHLFTSFRVLTSKGKIDISRRSCEVGSPMMCVKGILLIQVDFKESVMLLALEVLIPESVEESARSAFKRDQ